MIGYLKDTFLKVPTLALLVTITPNVLKYVCKSLQFRVSTQLYKESLDWPNITYFVAQIMKLGFEELDHLVTSTTLAAVIPKIMIFIDNIDMARKITIHL